MAFAHLSIRALLAIATLLNVANLPAAQAYTTTVLTIPIPDAPYTRLVGRILNIAGEPPTTTISISCPSATVSDAIISCALQPSNSLLATIAENTYAAQYTLLRKNGDLTATESCAASASTPTFCTTELNAGGRSTRVENPGGYVLAPVTVTAGPTMQAGSAGETGTATGQNSDEGTAARLGATIWVSIATLAAGMVLQYLRTI